MSTFGITEAMESIKHAYRALTIYSYVKNTKPARRLPVDSAVLLVGLITTSSALTVIAKVDKLANCPDLLTLKRIEYDFFTGMRSPVVI